MLVFRAEDRHIHNYSGRLEAYFNKRSSELVFDAMAEQPLYIYMALYHCFNSFTTFFYVYQGIYEEVVSASHHRSRTKRKQRLIKDTNIMLDSLLIKRRELPVSSGGVSC